MTVSALITVRTDWFKIVPHNSQSYLGTDGTVKIMLQRLYGLGLARHSANAHVFASFGRQLRLLCTNLLKRMSTQRTMVIGDSLAH